MRIRPLGVGDAAACLAASAAVGWRSDEVRWRRLLSVGDGFGAEAEDGALAGTVIVNRFGDTLATIAMMIVVPSFQRRGIGRRLLEAAHARAAGAAVYLFATDVGRLLYRSLGYVDEGVESERFEGRASTVPAPGVRPMRAADFAAVQALDAEAQGGPRGALLEALLSASSRAVVLEDRGTITAFGLATNLEDVLVLAPIVAREDAGARAIASTLAHGAADPIRLDLEPGERALRAWVEEAGLAPAGTSPRMIKDGRPLPGRRAFVRAMAGRAYG